LKPTFARGEGEARAAVHHEMLGRERLQELARSLYGDKDDPRGYPDRSALHVREDGRFLRRAAAAAVRCKREK